MRCQTDLAAQILTDQPFPSAYIGLSTKGCNGLSYFVEKPTTKNTSNAIKFQINDIIVWADEELPDIDYLDGWCDGMNEALSIAGKDMHLMVFHPNYDAEDAGLDFLIHDEQEDLEYCMVFVQRLSKLDDAAISLEKSGYYKHFPDDVFESLVLARRNLRYGDEER